MSRGGRAPLAQEVGLPAGRGCRHRDRRGFARHLWPGLGAALAAVILTAFWCGAGEARAGASPSGAPKVLLITAHPDDETLFDLGYFRERGWNVSVALVTNGENGHVVQAIRAPYDAQAGDDILIEKHPGPRTWLTRPPKGPRLRQILTPTALARERRAEFLDSLAHHGVAKVYFLSALRHPDFADSWDDGVTGWDKPLLSERLENAVRRVRPDIIITLNPDDTWAHPQHWGLARIVRALLDAGDFDLSGRPRPALYGLRENGWYTRSRQPEPGDIRFDRNVRSPVLGQTYAAYWRAATSSYISQSSHPIWFGARVRAGILPGYGGVDIIRLLEPQAGLARLDVLFQEHPPDSAAMARLPLRPGVVDLPAHD